MNNAFTNDSYALRAQRLALLSGNIGPHLAGLGLSPADEARVLGMAENFDNLVNAAHVAEAVKLEAFQTSEEADNALFHDWNLKRQITDNNFHDDDKLQEFLGLNEAMPNDRPAQIAGVKKFLAGNKELRLGGNPLALPLVMESALEALLDDAEAKNDLAYVRLRELREAVEALREQYDSDSKFLRYFLLILTAAWSADDARLIELGFVQVFPKGGGPTPLAPADLLFALSMLSWTAVPNATSYRLGYSFDSNDWENIGSVAMPETSIAFAAVSGTYLIRIQSHNDNGYGDWSAPYTLDTGIPFAGPEEVGVERDPATDTNAVTWGAIALETYKVMRCIKPLGNPPDTYTEIATATTGAYADVVLDTNVTVYYYIIAIRDEVESTPSPTVSVDIV